MHHADTGDQELLAMYEMLSADIPESNSWKEAARGTEWSKQVLGALGDVSRERYWLDFALWAPEGP